MPTPDHSEDAEQDAPQPKARRRPGPKPKPEGERARVRAMVTMVRSGPAWKTAVVTFADWDRAPSVSDLIDRAILSYARERGYDAAIPKR